MIHVGLRLRHNEVVVVAQERNMGCPMRKAGRLSLAEIEARVCDIAAEQGGFSRDEVHPGLRLVEDLNFDSLALVELLMEIEDAFDVILPDDPPNAPYKTVFTRSPFRVRDLAELVYLQQACGRIRREGWFGSGAALPSRH